MKKRIKIISGFIMFGIPFAYYCCNDINLATNILQQIFKWALVYISIIEIIVTAIKSRKLDKVVKKNNIKNMIYCLIIYMLFYTVIVFSTSIYSKIV